MAGPSRRRGPTRRSGRWTSRKCVRDRERSTGGLRPAGWPGGGRGCAVGLGAAWRPSMRWPSRWSAWSAARRGSPGPSASTAGRAGRGRRPRRALGVRCRWAPGRGPGSGAARECRGRRLGFDGAVALGPYQGPIRHLCLRLKRVAGRLAGPLAGRPAGRGPRRSAGGGRGRRWSCRSRCTGDGAGSAGTTRPRPWRPALARRLGLPTARPPATGPVDRAAWRDSAGPSGKG